LQQPPVHPKYQPLDFVVDRLGFLDGCRFDGLREMDAIAREVKALFGERRSHHFILLGCVEAHVPV
jgi:hypothetical protein